MIINILGAVIFGFVWAFVACMFAGTVHTVGLADTDWGDHLIAFGGAVAFFVSSTMFVMFTCWWRK